MPTGMSQRSNNPFDRLGRGSQRSAPSAPAQEPTKESSMTSAALLGTGAALGAAAGVVVAGAETIYHAAQDAVSPDERPADAEAAEHEEDPFGGSAPIQETRSLQHETDPFGAPTSRPSSAEPKKTAFDADSNSGFGDSFSASGNTPAAPTAEMHLAPSSERTHAPSDFDSAFADFDEGPRDGTKDGSASVEKNAVTAGVPSGVANLVMSPDLRPEAERSMSTQAVPPTSRPQTPTTEIPPRDTISPAQRPALPVEEELGSSEEEDEPEDLEAPKADYKGKSRAFDELENQQKEPAVIPASPPVVTQPIISPVEEAAAKVRRTAPPPPALRSPNATLPASMAAADDFDPFGAPTAPSSAVPTANVQPPPANKGAKFDDDDEFDFSDLPPAQVDPGNGPEHHAGRNIPSAFDEEFAGFDDDFDKPSSQVNSGSDNSTSMSKSYEMVSPPQQAPVSRPSEPVTAVSGPASRAFDGWNLGNVIGAGATTPTQPQSAGGFSFDDAFGAEDQAT